LANANQALSAFFAPSTLSRFYAFHPDPWIKNRHLKRRLFTPAFVEDIYQALIPGGEIFAQSDVKFLADEILEHLSAHNGLENLASEGFAKENATGIPSETELYWLERGDPVYYTHFKKKT
jgi:tRNA (guanine-N7-)-methyltransferase